jgi:lipopolysaccharide transport protein LptA/LPS export ABC transporter protein LptC
MTPWQRRLRLAVAVAAVALAVVVAFAFQRRVEVAPEPLTRADPKAILEIIDAWSQRQNRDKEDVRIYYKQLRSYEDGSAKLSGARITTTRSGGRTFTITADLVDVGRNEEHYAAEGNVHVTTSDGFALETGRATYAESDAIVRAPGPVTFSRGATTGSGVGFTYNKNTDVLRILDQVVINTVPKEPGAKPMKISSSSLELDRREHVVRFASALKAERGSQMIEADSGTARLTEDEGRLHALELRGRSSITTAPGGAGSLQRMSGRDIDLQYGADGETLEKAKIAGQGVIRVAGERGQASRQIDADAIDVAMAPDGSTPTALDAEGHVVLTLPADKSAPARTITADKLVGTGEAAKGLTGATFTGAVSYRERGGDVDRTASSEVLQASLKAGLSSIEDATFARRVRFVDGKMTATAAQAHYNLPSGILNLASPEAGAARPAVWNDQIAIDGTKIDVTLQGPKVHAAGAVKSVIQPVKDKTTTRPSMLKDDQPVNVTADDLVYDGALDKAVYDGNAQLWQGETTIKGSRITIDEKTGDLTASGSPVATTAVLMQTTKDGKKERSVANAKSKELKYEESIRRVTYTGDAFVNGPQGELRSPRIELFLKPSGDELERAEAYEGVTLTEKGRKTTGDRLTYFSGEEKYVITGAPLKVLDECGLETTGRTLTYLKGADRIIVDGVQQMRTRTQGGAKCP